MKKSQKGSALILVLVVLAVLLLGAASLARVTNTSGLLSGNVASKESSRHATEVGIATAYEQLLALADPQVDQGGWYSALDSGEDVPATGRWANAASVVVGPFTVRYLVERLCQGPLPVVDARRQCFVRQVAAEGSAKAGSSPLEAPPAMQYRISVRAEGLKGTQTLVQVMAHR